MSVTVLDPLIVHPSKEPAELVSLCAHQVFWHWHFCQFVLIVIHALEILMMLNLSELYIVVEILVLPTLTSDKSLSCIIWIILDWSQVINMPQNKLCFWPWHLVIYPWSRFAPSLNFQSGTYISTVLRRTPLRVCFSKLRQSKLRWQNTFLCFQFSKLQTSLCKEVIMMCPVALSRGGLYTGVTPHAVGWLGL